MDKALFVGDVRLLDSQAIRQTVLRIPEVGIRLKQIQSFFEKWGLPEVDIYTLINEAEAAYLENGTIRSAIGAAVQIGLFDRYKAKMGMPKMLIGNHGALPLLRVMAGQVSLEEVLAPRFVPEMAINMAAMVLPQTAGVFDVVRTDQLEILDVPLCSAQSELELIFWLAEEQGISQLINLGPGETISCQQFEAVPERISISESITIDPGLSWFWPALRAV